jgi:hypothetical protein
MKKVLACIIFLIAIIPEISCAQTSKGYHKKFYGNLGLGSGKVKQNFYEHPGSDIRFAMSLSLGYFIRPWLQLGATAGGWSYEFEDLYNWTKGIYISNTVAHVRFYPIAKTGLYASGGYGFCSFTNRNPGSNPQYSTGPGYMANLGYEHMFDKKNGVSLGALISYQWGKLHDFPLFEATNRNFSVWEAMLTFGID